MTLNEEIDTAELRTLIRDLRIEVKGLRDAIATAEARARAMVETLHLAQHTLIEHHAAGEPLEPGEMCGKCVKPGFSIFIEIEAALRGEPAPSIPIVEVGLAQLIAERDALKKRVEEMRFGEPDERFGLYCTCLVCVPRREPAKEGK